MKNTTKNTKGNRRAARIGRMLSREYGIGIRCSHSREYGYFVTCQTVGNGPLEPDENSYVALDKRRGTAIRHARIDLNTRAARWPAQLYAAASCL